MKCRQQPVQPYVQPGTVLLTLGTIGLVCLLIAQAGGLPNGLRSLILSSPTVWAGISTLLTLVGVWVAWKQAHPHTLWKPTHAGRRFDSLVVYTKDDCPLCDEAIETLDRHRSWLPPITSVDIEDDAELLERFRTSVPVVEIDGKIRFKGCVNEVLLQRLIEGNSPQIALKHR